MSLHETNLLVARPNLLSLASSATAPTTRVPLPLGRIAVDDLHNHDLHGRLLRRQWLLLQVLLLFRASYFYTACAGVATRAAAAPAAEAAAAVFGDHLISF